MKLFAHRAIETGSRCGRRSAVAGDERTHIVRPPHHLARNPPSWMIS
jgi:hypothetical protein